MKIETRQSADILLASEKLSLLLEGRSIVEDVSVTIRQAEIVTLIGPNGCGKTSLLKMLLGLLPPTSGTLYQKNGLRVGYMPQKFIVDPTIPVHVQWFMQLAAGKRPDKIEQALGECGVAHLSRARMQDLSGGELQRVLLARALLRQPDLLVLDEPVQGVDATGQARLYTLIQNVSQSRGCAVLMVSHDLHLVMSSTHQVICLNHHVCCSGSPHLVRDDPAFVALFGAQVAASLAIYTHHHDHAHH